MKKDCEDFQKIGTLTVKQREVMELLLAHKTSKEIARGLGISPHTVDQRIQFAKQKLGVTSRNEAAVEYRRLRDIYDPLTYEDSCIATPAFPFDKGDGSDVERALLANGPSRSEPGQPDISKVDYRVVPELFEGEMGTFARVAAILAIAALLVFIVLGGIAIFSEVSRIMAR